MCKQDNVKNNIWCFGDSFTQGHGCIAKDEASPWPYYTLYPEGELWTTIVANHFNYIEHNFGKGGCSTNLIIDTLITCLYKIKENDIVIVGSSFPYRDFVYNNRAKEFRSITNPKTVDKMVFSTDELYNDKLRKVLLAYIIEFNYDARDARETQFRNQIDNILNELQKRGVIILHWGFRTFPEFQSQHAATNGVVDDGHWSWKGHTDWATKCIELIESGITTYKTKPIKTELI
jgi:hypothetical protein